MKTALEFVKKHIAYIWLLIGYTWDVGYHIIRGKIMLDSDISAELLLANQLNIEHSLTGLSKNWIYTTGIRFLEMSWLFRPGLILFPNNWHAARTLSTSLAIAIMAFGAWLVFYAIGRKEWGVWAAAFTVFPGGGWYFWQTLYGAQILPYICLSFYCLALILLASRDIYYMRNRIYIVLLILLSVGAGINGLKQLLAFYMPAVLTAIVIYIIRIHTAGTIVRGKTLSFLIVSVASSVAAAMGFLINAKVLSKIYQFKQYNDTEIDYESFLGFLRDFIWCYGYADDRPLLSFSGVASMCGVLFGLFVVISGIRLTIRINKLTDDDQLVALFSIVCILSNCFMFSYLSGRADIEYFMPIVPFGYFLIVMELQTENFSIEKSRLLTINITLVLMLIISAGTIYNESRQPFHKYRAKQTLGPVVDMLVDKGYTQGVAQFWTADIVTELSNGKIEMWTLEQGTPVYEEWAQKKDHITNGPDGRYFYIFDNTIQDDYTEERTNVGLEYIEAHPDPEQLYPIYFDEYFIVYGN